MTNLPTSRLKETALFTHCGVGMFGFFIVKQMRRKFERYVAMFTCMGSRAFHIEFTFCLDTDSFILAFWRLVAQLGNVISVYSDSKSNFIGSKQELKKPCMEIYDRKIQSFWQEQGWDWIRWHKNPPSTFHVVGVWEQKSWMIYLAYNS